MRIFAHRGSHRPGLENTVAGVTAALAAGAHGAEVDVRLSRDGVPVCCHDPVHGPSGLVVAATPAAELAGAGVPSLEEVIVAAGGRLICEIKNRPGEDSYDGPQAATARAVRELLGALDPALTAALTVSSFDWFSLEALAGACGTAFLTPPGVAVSAGIPQALEHGCRELHAWHEDVRDAGPEPVLAGRRAGLDVLAWTVHDSDALPELARIGAAGAICADAATSVAAAGAPSAPAQRSG